jgi:MinD-like ATPase involved in chromosome partitioning or flagellar assembly
MTRIVSIHSYRGGTGKSNLTANLAWLLARDGRRVGVLDTDLQSPGVHVVFGFDTRRLTYTLSDFLFNRCELSEAAYDLSHDLGLTLGRGKVFLLPSSMQVEAITRILSQGYDVSKLNQQLHSLGKELDLDVVMLDTHPGLNRETMLASAVSDLLIVLLRPDQQDFHGTAVLLEVSRRLGVPKTYLLANKVVSTLGPAKLREMVRDAFGEELVGALPLSDEMASLGSRGLFTQKFPDHPISAELRAVAARLAAEVEAAPERTQ